MRRLSWFHCCFILWTWLEVFPASSFPLFGVSKRKNCGRLNSSSSTTPTSHERLLLSGQKPPFLAVITEPDACGSDERVAQTLHVLQRVLSVSGVNLISVRVTSDSKKSRVVQLVRGLVQLAEGESSSENPGVRIVVTSDWVDAAMEGGAHGIHVKESHRERIPEIRKQFEPRQPLIGTSAHSIVSAQSAMQNFQPDYLFVGTCYPTQTHPEKLDLEGPELPGQVMEVIQYGCPVFAIGGIHANNCAEPISMGATGVATIRAILQAKDPAVVVCGMKHNMQQAFVKSE
ncbi:Thiamine-phosphate synthase [Seminavis robusta]|uniref:Thiamine-phosphate synthase n=1 Tax=Seminavis robusta TaxID=568900 RepID=A0A9N8DM63_9STRA|nr:Thiamine-phosphate synthase [Seminavis robusta]|eukprot:Sro157_g071290.1 Thiamine-phosphate synthase (288) ;mRNA; f:77683-78546